MNSSGDLNARALPAKRRLAVFDIDGTLTDTVALHQASVIRVLQTYGFPDLNTDLGTYRHHTDAGVFQEAFEAGRGRTPDAAECAAFEAAFEADFAACVGAVPQIPGAAALVAALLEQTDWAVAFATGSYRAATMTKLARGTIPHANPIIATSSERRTRTGIVTHAIAGAGAFFGVATFDRVVALGDGRWDLEAAGALGLPFLGVGVGPKAALLASLGAQVVQDLTDMPLVLDHLATVEAPPHPRP